MLSCACYYWHVVTTRGSSQLFAPPASCCASSVVEENVSYAQVNPEAPKAIPRSNLALSFIVELCPRWEIMNIKVQMWGIMLDIPGGCRYFESSSFVSNLQVCVHLPRPTLHVHSKQHPNFATMAYIRKCVATSALRCCVGTCNTGRGDMPSLK